jgi:hypothetical protein
LIWVWCHVHIDNGDGGSAVIVVSEYADYPGASVTNAAETRYPGLSAKDLLGWLDQANDITLVEQSEFSGQPCRRPVARHP